MVCLSVRQRPSRPGNRAGSHGLLRQGSFPNEAWARGMRAPTIPAKMVEALDCPLTTLEISQPMPMRKSDPETRQCSSQLAWFNAPQCHPNLQQCSSTQAMPTDLEAVPQSPLRNPWLAGCAVHAPSNPQSLQITVQLNRQPVKALLGLGSTITLVWPSALPTPMTPYGTVKMNCMHRDA